MINLKKIDGRSQSSATILISGLTQQHHALDTASDPLNIPSAYTVYVEL